MIEYHDFKLWAPTEDLAKQAATGAIERGFHLIENGEWITARHTHAFDPVGTRWNDDGVIDPETGEVIQRATPMAGWFANLRVRIDRAENAGAALAICGAPLGVTIVEDTGREWAGAA